MSEFGSLRTTYTASGLERYEVEVVHRELNKYQLMRGDDANVVCARANAKAAEWDEAWAKRSAVDARRQEREVSARDVDAKKRLATERTTEAVKAIEALNGLLAHTLTVDDAIEWEDLKDKSPYPVPQPAVPAQPAGPLRPASPHEPSLTDVEFRPKIGFLDNFSAARKQLRLREAESAHVAAHAAWQRGVEHTDRQHLVNIASHAALVKQLEEGYAADLVTWGTEESEFLDAQRAAAAAIDARRATYETGDADALTDYCGMVLDNSQYPECFPQDFEIEYNPANKVLIVDYQLPSPAELPTAIEVKYIAARDEFSEKSISERQLNQLYDESLYQVALRTIHELFESDVLSRIQAISFNGWVKSVDRATGLASESCVLSIQVGRDEFTALDLAKVDPKICFKKLKGVAAAKLYSLTPVAPLLTMSREDKRFVSSYGVADSLTEGDNLAAMNWEDFEHLIRELFEKEFATTGAEVRVTQASRDGGVDAVIFDPDPLHGGKTVVQAKRYTNTVGVSAVRDLYGTMMNEGANKGILVTTSDYGPDAYAFAKGKPLVLLTGGNLLHLLANHGHSARIDLLEAKLLLSESD